MKILVIDNYDSFTYNLVHYLEDLDCTVVVKRNDKFSMEYPKKFDKIVLSPGPGIPDEAGKLKDVIRDYSKTIPTLGVCLGHQAIGEVYGGSLVNLNNVFHGVSTKIKILKNDTIFNDVPKTIEVGRYHSWVVKNPVPENFTLLSEDLNGQIMAMKHNFYPIYGVQFHPESVLTPFGKKILKNWIEIK